MKTIFKHTASRVWFIVTLAVVVIGLVINILASTMFFNTLCIVLNSPQRMKVLDETSESRFTNLEGADTRETAAEHGNQVTLEVCEEGFTLLKNEQNVLPLAEGARISVFGKNSVDMAVGGSGSGGSTGENAKTIFDSLSAAGFSYNEKLADFYRDDSASGPDRSDNPGDLDNGDIIELSTGETPWSSYPDDVVASFSEFNDAAIVVLTRIGGEGFDMPRSYLKLDENEQTLIREVGSRFETVIVLLNAAATIELQTIKADPNVDAILWVGFAGDNGMMALGSILNGEVNPSGKTVDTYATLESNPTWNNFGGEIGKTENYSGDAYLMKSGRLGYVGQGIYFVDEEEDIYVGYRYYETAYAEAQAGNYDGFDYDAVVAYPFGYGLSYTTFDWELENADEIPTQLAADTSMTFRVKVTNTGSVPGRDVVQLYVTPPYTEGGIEKSAKVLVGFAKTDVLAKGASQTVEITVDSPYLYASYDCYDKNANGFAGYEVEAGDYVFTLSTDAHNAKDMSGAVFTASVAAGIRYEDGATEGTKVQNLYTGNEDEALNIDAQLSQTLSRSDFAGTWPTSRTEEEKVTTEEYVALIKSTEADPNNPNTYTDMPKTGTDTEAEIVTDEGSETRPVEFADMVGRDYDDPLWEAFLDRFTLGEMVDLINEGAFQTVAIERLGVPLTRQSDGPVGWVNFMPGISAEFEGCCKYCCEVVLASTWNVDRLYDMGESVGNEGLVGSANGTFSGWYAPALNIHRSPMGGRNFEYYSEDPFLSGMMTASVMKGAATMGVFVNLKHFALNEQETHRSSYGLLTWATEQAAREIYLKGFEVAIKVAKADYTPLANGTREEGGAVKSMGVMSSFNRIGQRWTGGDYRLLTTILRDEWGFEGLVICDFNTCSHMVVKDMVYAGGDLNLEMVGSMVWRDVDANSAADVSVVRQAAKNILYTIVNSNAYRGEFVMLMPIWQIVMFIVDAVVVVGLGVWGFFAIRKAKKEQE